MGPYVHDRDGGGGRRLGGAGEKKCSEEERCDRAGDKSRAHEGSCGEGAVRKRRRGNGGGGRPAGCGAMEAASVAARPGRAQAV
ncbi:hypothetical protein GCM10010504_53840 [Streptomyces griseus]|nr:hypothetical protein GCM10010504_53840 [Streptomyces griseus]